MLKRVRRDKDVERETVEESAKVSLKIAVLLKGVRREDSVERDVVGKRKSVTRKIAPRVVVDQDQVPNPNLDLRVSIMTVKQHT